MDKPDLTHAKIVHGENETSSFHWREGLHFKRMESGGVRVVKRADYPSQAIPVMDFVIPPSEWASIVASVSKPNETHETWSKALAFHMGEPDSLSHL